MSSFFHSRNKLVSLGAFALLLLLVGVTAAPQQVCSTAPFSGPSFTLTSTGGHIQTNTASSDTAGTIAIASGTSASHSFVSPGYSSAPVCVVTPIGDPTAAGAWWVTTSGTSVPVHTHGTATGLGFNYVCIGNPT
jgi:hypothetical protein